MNFNPGLGPAKNSPSKLGQAQGNCAGVNDVDSAFFGFPVSGSSGFD